MEGFSKVVAVPATRSDREKNDRRVEMSTISLRCSSLVVGGGDVGVRNATVPSSSGETNNNTSKHFISNAVFFLEQNKVYFESRSFSASCPRRRETNSRIHLNLSRIGIRDNTKLPAQMSALGTPPCTPYLSLQHQQAHQQAEITIRHGRSRSRRRRSTVQTQRIQQGQRPPHRLLRSSTSLIVIIILVIIIVVIILVHGQ